LEKLWIIASYVTLVFAALVTTGLVVMYAFTQWEKTQVGRQFMLTKLSLALILDYWVLAAFVINGPQTTYSPAMPIRSVICTLVGGVMLRWLIILVRAQREARRKQ
jgi:hypothetical protein